MFFVAKGCDIMNKFTKFCNDTLWNFYRKRARKYLEESNEAHAAGDYDRGVFLYELYLNCKSKMQKHQPK